MIDQNEELVPLLSFDFWVNYQSQIWQEDPDVCKYNIWMIVNWKMVAERLADAKS